MFLTRGFVSAGRWARWPLISVDRTCRTTTAMWARCTTTTVAARLTTRTTTTAGAWCGPSANLHWPGPPQSSPRTGVCDFGHTKTATTSVARTARLGPRSGSRPTAPPPPRTAGSTSAAAPPSSTTDPQTRVAARTRGAAGCSGDRPCRPLNGSMTRTDTTPLTNRTPLRHRPSRHTYSQSRMTCNIRHDRRCTWSLQNSPSFKNSNKLKKLT